MDCPICLQNLEQPLVVPCCKKTYCAKCISEWNQIKNTCPMCCKVAGNKQVNNLKLQSQPQFDDGFIMLQNEIKQLIDRVHHIQQRINNRRNQFKNQKSVVSASLMNYLENESQRMEIFKNSMQEQFLLQNRGSTVQYMQLLTQIILRVQMSLENNSIAFDEDYQDDYDDYYYEEEQYLQENMEDYMDYQQFQEKADKKFGNLKIKKGKSNTTSCQTQNTKVVK